MKYYDTNPTSKNFLRDRTAGLILAASLAITACSNDGGSKDSEKANTNTSANQTESVSGPERKEIIKEVGKYAEEVVEFIDSQNKSTIPGMKYNRVVTDYEAGLISVNTNVTRAVPSADGKVSHYYASMEYTNENEDRELRLRSIGIAKTVTSSPDMPDSFKLDLEMIPVGDEGWRLAGSSEGSENAPFAFHSTEDVSGASVSIQDVFIPLDSRWFEERRDKVASILDEMTSA